MGSRPDKTHIEAALDAEVGKTLRGGLFPGLVVGIYKDGQTFIKGYGVANKETGPPLDGTTVFQIGSVSKVLTAALLQFLCDKGIVSMDATLGELIGASMPLSLSSQSVTLKQLATHTAGFPSIPKSLEARVRGLTGKEDFLLDPYSHLAPHMVFEYLATAEDKRAPGRFEYSNFGMGLLGHVLEHVTGKSYETLMQERVLAPLGMHSTSTTLTAKLQSRLAQGHSPQGTPTRVWTFAALAGAGAFYSHAEDMMRFVRANLEAQGATGASLRAMREPQGKGDTGIGWMQPRWLDRILGHRNMVWHNGMVGGYASYLSIDAQASTGVLVLTNQVRAPDMLGMMLARKVRRWA